MKYKEPPIGYWIKKADELLTIGINEIQAKYGLSRTKWQIINSIRENEGIKKTELLELMEPFAIKEEVEELLLKYAWDNLVDIEKDTLKLTENGIEFHKECLEQQKIFRQNIRKDISDDEYDSIILGLKKIVRNLDYLNKDAG